MKSCLSYYLPLAILQIISFAGRALAQNNSLSIKINGGKLEFVSATDNTGKEYKGLEELEKLPIPLDFSELLIKISGETASIDPNEIKLSIFNQAAGTICNISESALISNKRLSKFEGEKISDATEANFSDPKFKKDLMLFIELGMEDPITICAQNVMKIGNGANGATGTAKSVCANPHFYQTSYLSPVTGPEISSKPFFVIEHDFSNINNGPRIYKYHYDDEMKLIAKKKNVLEVGRMATIIFKYYNPNYNKISHNLSFKDFNQEDKTLFQSFIMNKNADKKEATNDGENSSKGSKVTSETSNPEMIKAIEVLKDQLSQFLVDIGKLQPSSLVLNSAISKVKLNIKECFIGLKNVNSVELRSFITQQLTADSYTKDIDKIISLLSQIESYSALIPPTFQIKNSDELLSQVSYFAGDENTATYSRDFSIPIVGGLKIDFSTGFIFSSLVNKTYLITDQPDKENTNSNGEDEPIAMKKIIEEDVSKYQIGFGILSHLYPRISKWLSVGLTTGFMVKENLAVQFPVGLSLLIGRESRFVLTAGSIFGERSELSARYQLGSDVQASSLTNITEDKLTVNKFKRAGFFALTYNFGGVDIGAK